MNTAEFGLRAPERVLDPREVLRTCARLFAGRTIREIRPEYLRLKPGTSLLVLYRVRLERPEGEERAEDDTTEDLWVHGMLGDGTLVERERAKWMALHPSLGPTEDFVVFDPEHDRFFARFPYDLGLRGLPGLSIPRRMKRLHEELGFPLGAGEPCEVRARGARVEILSYRPRRRCVVRWSVKTRIGDGPKVRREAIVRLLDQVPGPGLSWRRSGPDFDGVPRLLGSDPAGLVVFEEDLGPAALGPERVAALPEAIGTLIGRLHRWSAPKVAGAVCDFDAECRAEVRTALEGLAVLAPDLRPRCLDLAAACDRAFEKSFPSVPPTGLHGDLHGHQFVERAAGTGASSLAVVDLDRARPGPAEYDLASLVANLADGILDPARWSRALFGAWSAETGRKAEPGLLERYTACALLKSAADPLRRFAPDARPLTEGRLHRAGELLRCP